MSVYKRPGDAVYSYDFWHRGTRFSGSTECASKREAEKYEDAIRKEVKAQIVDRSKPMTFAAASSLYWDEKGQFLANSNDLERDLAWLQTKIGKGTLISGIGDSDISAAIAKRRGDGVSNTTVNRGVTQPMRAIMRRAQKTWKQSVQDIDWKDHFLPEPQERVREASVDEETAFMASIRGDYGPALRFAILSGCRRAEIVGMEWQHVDFFNREFTITGKGNRSRTIPMTKAIYKLLWSLKDNHKTAVFTYIARRPREGCVKGERYPISMEGFKTEWRRTKGRAGVKNYRFHDNRHTAATRLVRATGNLKLAQKLLGHTELATTSRYSHVTNDDLRAGMEAASPTQSPTKANDGAAKDLGNKEDLG